MIARTPLHGTTSRRAAATALGAAVLALAACGEDPAPTATTAEPSAAGAATPSSPVPSSADEVHGDSGSAVTEITVRVSDGQVQGPGDRVEVPLGSPVHLTVTSDTADEVHVHGYDRTLDLEPGIPATDEFPADIAGVFEVELHESGLQLFGLQVQ